LGGSGKATKWAILRVKKNKRTAKSLKYKIFIKSINFAKYLLKNIKSNKEV